MALHSVLGFVMTPFVVKAIGTVALDWHNFIAIGMLCASLTLVFIRATDARHRVDVLVVLTAGMFAAVVQTFGALGDPYFLLGGEANGGRYYLVSTCALILAIMLASVHRPRAMACVLGISLLVQGVASYSPAGACSALAPPGPTRWQNANRTHVSLPFGRACRSASLRARSLAKHGRGSPSLPAHPSQHRQRQSRPGVTNSISPLAGTTDVSPVTFT